MYKICMTVKRFTQKILCPNLHNIYSDVCIEAYQKLLPRT